MHNSVLQQPYKFRINWNYKKKFVLILQKENVVFTKLKR